MGSLLCTASQLMNKCLGILLGNEIKGNQGTLGRGDLKVFQVEAKWNDLDLDGTQMIVSGEKDGDKCPSEF